MSRLSDDLMGAAALASMPPLSSAEEAIGEVVRTLPPRERELCEDFIYMHLMAAQRARLAMDRMAWGVDYHHEYLAQRVALRAAAPHYRRLIEHGCTVPDLIADLIRAEGLAL